MVALAYSPALPTLTSQVTIYGWSIRQKQAAGRGRQTSGQVDQPQPPVHPCGRHAYLIGGPPSRPETRWAGTTSPTASRLCALIALLSEERQVIGGVAPEV